MPFYRTQQPGDIGTMPTRARKIAQQDAPPQEVTGYEDSTRAELLSMAKARGLSTNSRNTKDELIAALVEDDN